MGNRTRRYEEPRTTDSVRPSSEKGGKKGILYESREEGSGSLVDVLRRSNESRRKGGDGPPGPSDESRRTR